MASSTVLLDLTLSDLEGQNTYLMVLTLDFYLKFTSFTDVKDLDCLKASLCEDNCCYI